MSTIPRDGLCWDAELIAHRVVGVPGADTGWIGRTGEEFARREELARFQSNEEGPLRRADAARGDRRDIFRLVLAFSMARAAFGDSWSLKGPVTCQRQHSDNLDNPKK